MNAAANEFASSASSFWVYVIPFIHEAGNVNVELEQNVIHLSRLSIAAAITSL